jgi:hypothetical protein
MMGTWSGMISNLADRWTLFVEDMMGAGPMKALKANLGDWLSKLDGMAKSGELKKLAEEFGGKLGAAFEDMRDKLPKLVGDLKVLASTAERVVDKIGGLETTLKAVAAIVVGGPLISAVGKLSGALWGLGAAAAPIAARAGVAIGAGAGAAGGLAAAGVGAASWQAAAHWSELKELFSDPTKPGGIFPTLWEMVKDPAETLFPNRWSRTAGAAWMRDLGARPTLGAASAMAGSGASGGQTKPAHVILEIERLQKGERAEVKGVGGTEIDLSLGYSMMPSH